MDRNEYRVTVNNYDVYKGPSERIAVMFFGAFAEDSKNSVQLFSNEEIALEQIGTIKKTHFKQQATERGINY